MKVEAPERIWIESDGECPYFYEEEELSDVAPPITEYVRADKLRAEIEALRGALEEAEAAMRFVHASCATFPQEPRHVQNAAWRRIVNAVAKARAALKKENSND